MNLIQQIEAEEIAKFGKEIPEFRAGDTVRVGVKVKEGNRERVQNYEGVVIARSNRGMGSNFTVRKMSFGEGVERVFPALFADRRKHHRGPPRRGASRQALLPARPHRQERAYRRAQGHRAQGVRVSQATKHEGRPRGAALFVCGTCQPPSSLRGA